jgi:hypothetical protein
MSRQKKYKEETSIISFRVPKSKHLELKKMVDKILDEHLGNLKSDRVEIVNRKKDE